MDNSTSPGGGYRKGDGAQEENLFRRSDYFRSLDIDLDRIQEEIPERFFCSYEGKILPLVDHTTMYPIDEYGAIYTSGLTFFRQSEDKGYEYMEKPLEGVNVLALAAYRNPKLDGNMLSPKYAVGMRKKIENLFSIVYNHHHECLILSALGCGAFRNPPDHVAKLFRSVIEQYAGFFQTIIFAVTDDHHTGQKHNPSGNHKPFKDELDGLVFQPVLSLNYANLINGPYRIGSDGSTINYVIIFDLPLCQYGAKCDELYDSKHVTNFFHPALCKELYMNGVCKQTNDLIHMTSFIHRNPCEHGAHCKDIDDVKHNQDFEHPSYCPNKGNCEDTSVSHEKAYRHLPLCEHRRKCPQYQKHVEGHCEQFRHCNPSCELGNNCIYFHDRQHIEAHKHPFPYPCPFTPYHCLIYEQFISANNNENIPYEVEQHCLDYAHICQLGRKCTNKNPLHKEKSIHVLRPVCPFTNQCTEFVLEDHLNSFTHPNVFRDIRFLCKYADKCYSRQDPIHVNEFRHNSTLGDSGIVRFYNLNENVDIVQNQKDNIERVLHYIKKENWRPLKTESISQDIIDWIRTVRPVHRCRPEIFESILLHGHVMSRDYMENLTKIPCVVDSVLQHSQIKQIKYANEGRCAHDTKTYVTALVQDEFDKQHKETRKELIKSTKVRLSHVLSHDEIKSIEKKAIEIAQASIKLHSKPTGIGYTSDVALGTNKNVFSVLGPHTGTYGDVFIVFKREILHHPDSNFSIQSATSYVSGNCFKWRLWLGDNPGSDSERIKLFHKSKLHASIPGYEYATALELIASVSQDLKKKSMNIDLKTILDHWLKRDSHKNIEGHLPQLIPLDYIDHVYIKQDMFDAFDPETCQAIKTIFNNRISIKPFQSVDNYRKFVIKDITDNFGERDIHSILRPIQGFVITIPSTNFNDYFLLPLTISQAYKQYKNDHPKAPTDATVYIYWQAMNGDMMLTLSNEQINTGEPQPNLRCLISYIAEKPSTNDVQYHEHASYLHAGIPFQHEIVVKERKYAAKSNSFFMGCNTDDFMTFYLEIRRSTGQVILSHAGPNSIYNHERITSKFAKSDLHINQLDYIHVSAGTHIVPIRNLIITFEKRVEPLDGIYSNIETNLTEISHDNPADNDEIISSNDETVKQTDQNLGKI